MQSDDLPPIRRAAWQANLRLRYAREGARTALMERAHSGPLAIQKSLYPEGDAVCHSIVLHPPAGIVGGDALEIDVKLDARAHAVLTTPGAGKWYRSAGSDASQALRFDAADDAMLEWLPQETIVYAGARAQMRTDIRLGESARYLGWEIVCLGRPAADESFAAGSVRQLSSVHIGDALVWNEQGQVEGGDAQLQSAVALANQPVYATLIAAGRDATPDCLNALRALRATEGRLAITALDRVVLVRYLGASTEAARLAFAAARTILRPWLCGVADQPLRLWRT